ncbi:MAG: ROK family transcriptional regulator [Hyphomicrobiaceae bacterium]
MVSKSPERPATSRTILTSIVEHGPVSRARLSRLTGISKPTTSEIVGDLERSGLVQQSGRTNGGIGRTAVTYELCRDAAYFVACDLGASKIHMAIADLGTTVLGEVSAPTERNDRPRLKKQLQSMLNELLAENRIDRRRVRMAVVGTPGVVDRRTGSVALVPNIPAFEGVNLPKFMQAVFGSAVMIENDVNLGVIGEHAAGHGSDNDNLVYLALGTGIGMGLLVDGRLVRGHSGAAGEIAYLPIGGDPFEPVNVSNGTLESSVGAAAIVASYQKAGGERGMSVRSIFERLGSGDTIAETVVRDLGRHVALGIAAVAAVLDPNLVVLGGSIGARPELAKHVRLNLSALMLTPPAVEVSSLGNRGPIEGALIVGGERLQREVLGLDATEPLRAITAAGIRKRMEAAE